MTIISVLAAIVLTGIVLYFLLGQGLLRGEREWFEKSDIAVFTSEQARAQSAFHGKDAEFYTPSSSDIQTAEELFRKEIPNFDNYYRQYYGTRSFVDRKRVINLRAVAKTQRAVVPNWRKELILVLDGGDSYVTGTANVDTGLVLHSPNGQS